MATTSAPKLRSVLTSPDLMHLIRYAVIGAGAVGIDLGAFLLLHNAAGWRASIAHTVSVGLAVLFSFTLNSVWNFETTDNLARRFASFVAVSFIGYLVGLGVIWIASPLVPGEANTAKLISLPLVFVVQFLLNRRITFAATAPGGRN